MLTKLSFHIFLVFFLIIELCLLISVATALIFSTITEVVFPIGIPEKAAKTEIKIHPVIAEAKVRKCLI